MYRSAINENEPYNTRKTSGYSKNKIYFNRSCTLPNTLTEKKSAIETKTNHSLYGIIAISLYHNSLFNLYVNIW